MNTPIRAEYTDPAVLTTGVQEGWAEPVTDPGRISAADWDRRKRDALIPFKLVHGRPVIPYGTPRITRGRNGMGLWSVNPMSDLVALATVRRTLHVLLVVRKDNGRAAVPGGSVNPGESRKTAAVRECREETGLTVDPARCVPLQPRVVHLDERASREAWPETQPFLVHIGSYRRVNDLPHVVGMDDARSAIWAPVPALGHLDRFLEARHHVNLWAAHKPILTEALTQYRNNHGGQA